MADSSTPYTKSHFSLSYQLNSPFRPKKPIEQQGRFYFKSLIFALFFIVLALLFPSQAPEFITQTIFTKLWELLHILFIGIAVAYGLFSTRNNVLDSESDLETHSIVENTPNYVSKMFPISSIFGDGCEIPCGSDEKRMMMMVTRRGELGFVDEQYKPQLPNSDEKIGDSVEDDETNVVQSWNSKDSEGELGFVDEQCKSQLSNSEENFGDSVEDDGTNVVQSWNSEYHQMEPEVVMAQPYYTIGEFDEIVAYKPLGLPVRSLRSSDESDYSSSGSRVSSSKRSDKSIDREFGDLGPSNLEQKFNDAAGFASPIMWHSRSRRFKREDKHVNVNHPPEVSLQESHSNGYSIRKNPKDDDDDMRGLNGIIGKELPGNIKGKSVRTRRPSEPSSEMMRTGEICSKRTDNETVAKMPDSVKEIMDPPSPKEEPSKESSNEDLEFELENCWMSSDEEDEVVSECVNNSGLDSEVDKKASEFIAKFKAQIRLQKEASIERSRRLARDLYKL